MVPGVYNISASRRFILKVRKEMLLLAGDLTMVLGGGQRMRKAEGCK